jgi:hypothetical protein
VSISVRVDPSARSGERLLLPGARPGESRGPWREEERAAVHRALARYLDVAEAPERKRRCRVESFLPEPDRFEWCFTAEEGPGAAAAEIICAADRLYAALREECDPVGLGVVMDWSV